MYVGRAGRRSFGGRSVGPPQGERETETRTKARRERRRVREEANGDRVKHLCGRRRTAGTRAILASRPIDSLLRPGTRRSHRTSPSFFAAVGGSISRTYTEIRTMRAYAHSEHVRMHARATTRIDVACHTRPAVLTAEGSHSEHYQAEPQTIFTSASTSGERSHFLHSGAHTSL